MKAKISGKAGHEVLTIEVELVPKPKLTYHDDGRPKNAVVVTTRGFQDLELTECPKRFEAMAEQLRVNITGIVPAPADAPNRGAAIPV